MKPRIVSARWVIAAADKWLQNHSVIIRGPRIAEVLPTDAALQRYAGCEVIGGDAFAVIPGLINAHHHCVGVPYRDQGIADDILEFWLFATLGAAPIPTSISTKMDAIALLKSGVTSVVDMCSTGSSPAELEARVADKAEAYGAVGLRAAIAPGERWKNRLVHAEGEESAFLHSLPSPLRARLSRLQDGEARLAPDAYLAAVSRLAEAYRCDPAVSVWFGPVAPHWTPDETLRAILAAAEALDTRVQTHALESFYEGLESARSRGRSLIRHLHTLDLLHPRLSLAHMVWAAPDEIELLAAAGVPVVCNPSSNLRLRSGVAPGAGFAAAGIPLALGLDGTSLADDEDIFAEMRLFLNLNRPARQDAEALDVGDVFRAATEGGARVLGRAGEIGRIEPGRDADLVLIELSRLARPWLSPALPPLDVIVNRAKATDVRHVFVRGELRLRDRQVLGVDEDEVERQIAEAIRASAPRSEQRQLAADLRPHLAAWYGGWEDDSVRRDEAMAAPMAQSTSSIG
ncbi:MAG: amidohydrolase family protein [Kiloniellales bacterium]|nr:amidohydrolase family protein [Kiloniellales bacterium]